MTCHQCGKCCETFTFHVPHDDDMERFYRFHAWDVRKKDDGSVDVVVYGPCTHLLRNKTGASKCAIYIHRPAICRAYTCDAPENESKQGGAG